MTDLIPFDYDGASVRVITVEGEPWFVLADICRVLDLGNPSMVANRLDGDALSSTEVIDSMGREQRARIVSEAGLYEVIFLSRKPEAKTFRRWVTSEVLPSIRKTGSYGTPRELTPDEIVHQALQITAQRVEELTAQLAIAGPKAAAFDLWLSSNLAYAVGDVAKALRAAGAMTGRTRLFEFMDAKGWIFRQSGQWHPAQSQVENGRLRVRLGQQLNTRTGEQFQTVTVQVTPKGAIALAKAYGVDGGVVADSLDSEVAA